MTSHVMLNQADHQHLRVKTERTAALGDSVMHAPVFPFEFRSVQAHYPILFHKDGTTGELNAVALFGFERGENLFLGDDGWDAPYVPITLERGPFLIGFASEGKTVVHMDMDSPRVSESEGEPLFAEDGSPTPYVQRIANILEAIHEGVGEMRGFAAALTDLDLLEPMAVDIELEDGSKNRLEGLCR